MMRRMRRWFFTLALMVGIATTVGGQVQRLPQGVLPPPPPLQLLPPANTTQPQPMAQPDSQYRDAVGMMGRLVSEMLDLREELQKLPAQQRIVVEPLRRAIEPGEALYREMLRGASPREIRTDFRRLRPLADDLIGALRQSGPLTPLGRAAGRMEYQLGRVEQVVLGKHEEADDRTLVRSARVLKEQAEQLVRMGGDSLPDNFKGQKLEKEIQNFAEDVDRLRRSLERGEAKKRIDEDWSYVRETWRPTANKLDKLRYDNQTELRDQARRVNELFVQTGRLLGHDEQGLPDFSVITAKRGKPFYAVSAGAGAWPVVVVYDDAKAATYSSSFMAYDREFKGGVRIAIADVDGDGTPDVVTVQGPGMPCLVRVFSGKDLSLIHQFLAYDQNYRNGAFVAAADFDNDGKAEIVIGPDVNAQPVIQIYQGHKGTLIREIEAWPRGQLQGMRVALGDFNGDRVPDLAVCGGPGCNSVRLFDGSNFRMFKEFLAYPPAYTGGLYLAAGDFRKTGRADLVVGCDGEADASILFIDTRTGQAYDSLKPFGPFQCGVRVGVADINQDGVPDVLCVPGPAGVAQLRVLDGATRREIHAIGSTVAGDWFRGGTYTDGR